MNCMRFTVTSTCYSFNFRHVSSAVLMYCVQNTRQWRSKDTRHPVWTASNSWIANSRSRSTRCHPQISSFCVKKSTQIPHWMQWRVLAMPNLHRTQTHHPQHRHHYRHPFVRWLSPHLSTHSIYTHYTTICMLKYKMLATGSCNNPSGIVS